MFDNPYIREHQQRLQQQYKPSAAPKPKGLASYEALLLLITTALVGFTIALVI